MAGWGPNGAYAMVAGWRFLGQLLGYSMPIVMAIAAIAMRAESLMTTEVVDSQAPLWNAVYQPFGFVVFFLAAMALAFLPPFDLPMAPGELAGGVEAEYTGWRLAIFRLARTLLILTIAAAITVFYLGGWLGPRATAVGVERAQDAHRGGSDAACRKVRAPAARGAPPGVGWKYRHPARALQHLLRRRPVAGGR